MLLKGSYHLQSSSMMVGSVTGKVCMPLACWSLLGSHSAWFTAYSIGQLFQCSPDRLPSACCIRCTVPAAITRLPAFKRNPFDALNMAWNSPQQLSA